MILKKVYVPDQIVPLPIVRIKFKALDILVKTVEFSNVTLCYKLFEPEF